jgi:MoaA/NifB/PqqE/SkfB family radical SAM enzyme
MSTRIPGMVEDIAGRCPRSQVIINLSLDGIAEEHDRIRGVEGNFERAVETYRGLRALKAPNLTVGVHTVISVHNVERVPDIYEYVVRELQPDSFITEIAEERVELETMGAGITPPLEAYAGAVDFLIARIKEQEYSGISRITQSFRVRYYELVKRYLAEGSQPIPCYSGVASAQIAPDGDVWFCCIKADPVGNLRDAGYDFGKVWFSEKADVERRKVRAGECSCPLANAAYTNMLMHVPTVGGVAFEVATGRHPGGGR